jgi:integral membrane sensor domain MASE1
MELMNVYKMEHYALVPIAIPLYANLVWRRSSKPSLVRERLILTAGFVGSCILAEYTPVSWSFTFVLFPFSMFILVIGFLFLKRKLPS